MSIKKLFALLLVIATLFVSGCFDEKESNLSNELSEDLNTKNILYSPIYGEYNDETFLKKDDFFSILREIGTKNYIEETSGEGFERLSYVIEDCVASVEIYNSVEAAKKNYYNSFLFEDGNLKSSLIVLNFDSSLRIGNMIVFGNEKAVNPICDYFNIDIVEKRCIYEVGFEEYDCNINVSEIVSYMKENEFTQYESQSFNGELYKVFVNFTTNDCVSIIKCESIEKAKNKAKSLSAMNSSQGVGCVCICAKEYVFVSRGDTWKNLGLTERGFEHSEK